MSKKASGQQDDHQEMEAARSSSGISSRPRSALGLNSPPHISYKFCLRMDKETNASLRG